MQAEVDACQHELESAAARLTAELRPVIPAHVSWTVQPSRKRSLLRWYVEDRLSFERDFGGPVVELHEPIRRRRLRGGPWTSVATPEEAATRLLANITVLVRDGDFDK